MAKYTDEELVGEFWRRHDRHGKERSVWGARQWMLEHAPRLYKIMLDGLQAKLPSSPEPNQGWIAVEERLPKPDEDNPSHSIEVQFWNDRLKRVDQGMLWFVAHKEGYWEGRCYAERDEVTYWRELPAPPVASQPAKEED